jgi:hypothetical protein
VRTTKASVQDAMTTEVVAVKLRDRLSYPGADASVAGPGF